MFPALPGDFRRYSAFRSSAGGLLQSIPPPPRHRRRHLLLRIRGHPSFNVEYTDPISLQSYLAYVLRLYVHSTFYPPLNLPSPRYLLAHRPQICDCSIFSGLAGSSLCRSVAQVPTLEDSLAHAVYTYLLSSINGSPSFNSVVPRRIP